MAGISTKHPDYVDNEEIWKFCETFYEGEIEIKKLGTKLLPQLSGQTPQKYDQYKNRAVIYGAVPRTVSALVGAIFRKEPFFQLPEKLQYMVEDATGTGMSLTSVAILACTELMVTARAGLLVDMAIDGGKPYFTVYDADDIINWSEGNYVVLENEQLVPSEEDKYTLDEVEGYRELMLDSDGNYVVNIWGEVETATGSEYEITETIKPLRYGKPITYMPFVCMNTFGLDFDVVKPPILELCQISHKHYMTSADHANALHVAACPTPIIAAGITTEDFGDFKMGPDACTILPENGKAFFLEFNAQGVQPLESAMTKYEQMLAALGARVIETTSKSTTEKAEGVRTREAAATAVLSSIIASIEAGLTRCLRWAAEWEGADPNEVKVKLNRELVSSNIDANMLTALTGALQANAISQETYFRNLEEAGLTDPGVTFEKESALIAKQKQDSDAATEVSDTPDNEGVDTPAKV